MSFPQASIEKAKEIAHLYKQRSRTKSDMVSHLANLHFLHTHYGFNDAVKRGRGGHYLHELAYDSDCFSMAGMLYLIARESGLKPQIYRARGMKDIREHQNSGDKMGTDHAFITVQYGGARHVIDPYYSQDGKIQKQEGSTLYLREDDNNSFGSWQIIRREANSLEELSEEAYIDILERNRSPRGGKLALEAGQILKVRDDRLSVEYKPATQHLHSIYSFSRDFFIDVPRLDKCLVWDLQAPVHKDGTWQLQDGVFHLYNVKTKGWLREEDELRHNHITLPFEVVQGFMDHFQQATTYLGYKKKIQYLGSQKKFNAILRKKAGFNSEGEFTKSVGVCKQAHKKLLLSLEEAIANRLAEPSKAIEELHLKSYYDHLRREEKKSTKENFLASKEDLDAHTKYLADMHWEQRAVPLSQTLQNSLLADVGLLKNKKIHDQNFRLTANKDFAAKRFSQFGYLRRANPDMYHYLIDYSLFYNKYKDKELPVTKLMIDMYMKGRVVQELLNFATSFFNIQLQSYQKGLKKILAR